MSPSIEHHAAHSMPQGYYVRVVLSVYLIWCLCFPLVALYSSTLPATNLAISLDHEIPVIPGFVWLYDACFLLPFLVLIVPDRHRINRLALSFTFANLISYCSYVCVRVAPEPPQLGTSFADRVLSLHHGTGFIATTNNFPSMHVIFVWLFYLACREQGRGRVTELVLLLFAIAVSASTLVLKMHVFADVLAGLLVAIPCWVAVSRWYSRAGLASAPPAAALRTALRRMQPVFATLALSVVAAAALRRLFF